MSDDAYYEDTVQAELIRVIDQCNEAIRVITDEYYAACEARDAALREVTTKSAELTNAYAELTEARLHAAVCDGLTQDVQARDLEIHNLQAQYERSQHHLQDVLEAHNKAQKALAENAFAYDILKADKDFDRRLLMEEHRALREQLDTRNFSQVVRWLLATVMAFCAGAWFFGA